MKTSILFTLTAGFLGLVNSANATAILTLAPVSGVVSGLAGSTVGWGFTLTSTSDYAVVSSSSFCLGTSGVTSLCVTPTIGTYTDDIAANFVIAGPAPENPVVTQSFSSSLLTGVGSFSIASAEPLGATNSGQLVLTYDLYSVDPNFASFDPAADLVSAGNFLTAAASVSVGSVPEPDSGWLMAAAGLVLVALRAVTRKAR